MAWPAQLTTGGWEKLWRADVSLAPVTWPVKIRVQMLGVKAVLGVKSAAILRCRCTGGCMVAT